jgi:hypothetical protein
MERNQPASRRVTSTSVEGPCFDGFVMTVRRSCCSVVIAATMLVPVASAEGAVARSVDSPLPDPGRTEVAGARWQGRIVVGGGLVAVPGGFVATRDLFVFDPGTNSWSRGPDLPGPRDHAALAAVGGHLYLVGGYSGSQGLVAETREVWRLDSVRESWRRVADLGTARGALAVAVASGHVFALGGVSAGRVLATTEWYDPRTDAWRPGPEMATPREHFGAARSDGRVYAVGGRNSGNVASVESLPMGRDGPRGVWRVEPALLRTRGGNAAATAGQRVCTAGGEEPAGTIGSVECLRGEGWERVGDLRVPRHGLAVVAIGRSLHVVSGGPQPGATFSTAHEVLAVHSRTRTS